MYMYVYMCVDSGEKNFCCDVVAMGHCSDNGKSNLLFCRDELCIYNESQLIVSLNMCI